MRELALFAGGGGGILGGHLLGWRTVCAVEIDDYARRILLARQRDGILPRFPIWDDVRTFNGRPWRGRCDIISGGFPCTDISLAKRNAEGIHGPRSGLWKDMARIVAEIGPRFVFIENVGALARRGLDTIIRDLADQGFGGRVTAFPALFIGADHPRVRLWILADAYSQRWEWRWPFRTQKEGLAIERCGEEPFWQRAAASGVSRIGYGIPHRVDRLRAVGNGQVPAVAAIAFRILSDGLI